MIIFVISFSALPQTVETITSSFNASGGVSIDDSGIVYVADFGQFLNQANGTKVYKVYDDGNGTTVEFATGLFGASGNAFDSQGNLFQSNIAGNRLSKITSDGTVTTFATNGIQGPVGVAVADGDTIYVANCGGNSIAKVLPNGTSSVWVSSTDFQCPNGLTIDDNGNLYTCNFGNGNIVKITPDKQVSVLATLPGGRCGHLTYFEGYLYVAARCAQKIYRVTLNGDTTLIAGSGARGNDDGPALQASFNHPNGVEAVRDGDNVILYINDATSLTGNCTTVPLNPVVIRKITIPDSVVSINENETLIPNKFKLYQNFPNPFNPSTKIKYEIPSFIAGETKQSSVTLKIYDLLGNEMATLVDEQKSAGTYEVEFSSYTGEVQNLTSGVYFYQLRAENFIETKKMILMK
jgi:hypothetical protein